MGEVDQKPFQDVCAKKFSRSDWEVRSVESISLWQEKVSNPGWQPFKNTLKDGKWQVESFQKILSVREYKGSATIILCTCCSQSSLWKSQFHQQYNGFLVLKYDTSFYYK